MYQNKQGQPQSAGVRTQNLKLNSRSVAQSSSRPFETTFSPMVSPSDGFCSATLDNNSYDLYSSSSSLYNDQMLWESAFEVPGIKLESDPLSNELPNLVKAELADDVHVNTSWTNELLGRDIKEEIEETGETKNAESGQNGLAHGLKHISAYEEYELLKKLEQSKSHIGISLEVRRLYRKLQVRHARRTENLPQFNFDRLVRKLAGQSEPALELEPLERDKENDERILDRFQIKPECNFSLREYSSFKARLLGDDEVHQKSFISPYTKKVLKTVIWRDNEAKPLKLQILQGILSASLNKGKRGGDHPCSFVPELVPMSCIEYRYIQSFHIPIINAMARDFFWPGIDISDCLQYPDFTCVALYKKVIIGFCIMVPDVSFNEAYISFLFTHPEWRNAGISTFMLYHLLQTSLGKDITLHVEATNPAVFLYQRFCFKIEEFIADFYDKYLPASSSQCKHALFMRLSR